jgi:hypothetical protein
VTQIDDAPKIKDGPTSKEQPTNKNGPTTRLEEAMTNHVRQENIATQIRVREKRVASEINDLGGNSYVQGQHRKH